MRRKEAVKKKVFFIISEVEKKKKQKASNYGMKCHLNSTLQFKHCGQEET